MNGNYSAPANGISNLWQLLAISDAELEKADLVLLNLAVAVDIPSHGDLDIPRYARVVDDWAGRFSAALPGMEAAFRETPERWLNDIRFFRIGQLMGFLGHEIGISYIDEQKKAEEVWYTNPGDLFLNGLIDTKRGTCANMPVLHAAIARRLGWPVSIASLQGHFISRFDDGQVVYNIEATSAAPGAWASGSDADYMKKLNHRQKAIDCGSDLRKLSAREMIGVFLHHRGRHYCDVKRYLEADQTYALARALFPCYRRAFIGALVPMLTRGAQLFDPDEAGHPNSLHRAAADRERPEIWPEEPLAGSQGAQGSPQTVIPTSDLSSLIISSLPLGGKAIQSLDFDTTL